MDRKYSIQPIIAKEKDEEKDTSQDASRRGRTVPNFGKIRKWVKRSNVPRDLSKPLQEARGSWDESMQRRGSEAGLRGIVLRKGLSDDAKAFPLVKTENRRTSRADASLVASGKRLCKWDTVNLLGIRKHSVKKEEVKPSTKSRASGVKDQEVHSPTREVSESEVSHSSTVVSECSTESLDNLGDPEERLDSTVDNVVTSLPPRQSVSEERESALRVDRRRRSRRTGSSNSASRSNPAELYTSTKITVGNSGSSSDINSAEHHNREDYETIDCSRDQTVSAEMAGNMRAVTPGYQDNSTERRPSIIPTVNITNDPSNLERFLDSIGTTGVGSILEEPEDTFLGRARSCESLHQKLKDSMSIWERRKRATRDFSPGTRPIILNIEDIDDSVFCSRSVSNTLVEISSRAETYICKDDLLLGTRNMTFSASSKASSSSVGSSSHEGRGAAAGEGAAGRGGSKLKKPTNLWGVTRRISVRRRKVVKEERNEESSENTEDPR